MFEMLPNDKQNSVRFVSDAPTEKIVGKTNQISATLELDPDNVAATAVGVFEVDLTTLKTGIGLRDRHMRENHLETDEFPVAIFRLIRVISTDKPALIPGEQVQVDAEGELILHGVAKTYRIPVTVRRAAVTESGGSELRISAEWTLKLADHKIARPELLFLKLAEEQQISVDFTMAEKP